MGEKLTETSLSAPVAAYFGELGYTVRAEVNHCDLVAVRDAEIVAVELKLTLNLDVLVQATRRQQAADKVYIAVPRPRYVGRTARWRGVLHLLRRLELGLLLVSFASTPPSVEVVLYPEQSQLRRKSKARHALKEEAANRSLDLNVGGSAGRKLMTSYRENALRIAFLLAQHGPLSAKRLRELCTGDNTWSILHRNYAGYFARCDRGVYDVTEKGHEALSQHAALVAMWEKG